MTLHPQVTIPIGQHPALHFAGKSPVGSCLLGKALDSTGLKPTDPLGATKLNKSHDQQNAIKTYSVNCLLHI